jgi:hypothetical protein
MTSEFDQVLASAVLEMAREPSAPATIERLTGFIVEAVDTLWCRGRGHLRGRAHPRLLW